MEPGTELDIAVAKVSNLTVYTPEEADRVDIDDYWNVCVKTKAGLQCYQPPDHHGIWRLKPWSPSTDIAVAMGLFKTEWILTSMDIGHKVWVVYRDLSELESGAAVGESTISAAHAIALAIIEHERGRAAYDAAVAELGW